MVTVHESLEVCNDGMTKALNKVFALSHGSPTMESGVRRLLMYWIRIQDGGNS